MEAEYDSYCGLSCGTRFKWYMETCPQCGEELCNSVKQEKELQGDPEI